VIHQSRSLVAGYEVQVNILHVLSVLGDITVTRILLYVVAIFTMACDLCAACDVTPEHWFESEIETLTS
jgi:hypothetical protein